MAQFTAGFKQSGTGPGTVTAGVVKQGFPEKAPQVLPPIEDSSESRGPVWPFRAGLPWQPLQDSVASADKEEEVAVPKKARCTFPRSHTRTELSQPQSLFSLFLGRAYAF